MKGATAMTEKSFPGATARISIPRLCPARLQKLPCPARLHGTKSPYAQAIADAGVSRQRVLTARYSGWFLLQPPGVQMGKRFASVWDALPPGLRDATESTCEPLSGAAGTCTTARTENATKAILWAASIASNNWTDAAENATRPRDTEQHEVSNEKS
jgi:hypothetical protein